MRNTVFDFFAGRKVFLTGHTGFKGGWLATWLKLAGARVAACALPPPAGPSLYDAARVSDGIDENFVDIRHGRELLENVRRAEPEVIFHLAAQPLVRQSYRDPVATYATNILGTVHLLEAARLTPSVRAVVVITSDKCYENDDRHGTYSEADVLGGADPYSSSKACAEIVTSAWGRSFFSQAGAPRVATCRAGNVIGGGDWSEDRLVPDIVRSLASGHAVTLRSPEAVRPWQHVLEPLYGYLLAARVLYEDRAPVARCWNFGPAADSEITVRELATRLLHHWGGGEIRCEEDRTGFKESGRLRLNSTRAFTELGWQAVLGIEETARLTVEWYRSWLKLPAAATRLTVQQIEDYSRLAGTEGRTDRSTIRQQNFPPYEKDVIQKEELV